MGACGSLRMEIAGQNVLGRAGCGFGAEGPTVRRAQALLRQSPPSLNKLCPHKQLVATCGAVVGLGQSANQRGPRPPRRAAEGPSNAHCGTQPKNLQKLPPPGIEPGTLPLLRARSTTEL